MVGLEKPMQQQMCTAAELNAACYISCYSKYMAQYRKCMALIVASSWIITAMHEDCETPMFHLQTRSKSILTKMC